jgi:hypothetical protein
MVSERTNYVRKVDVDGIDLTGIRSGRGLLCPSANKRDQNTSHDDDGNCGYEDVHIAKSSLAQ